MSQYGSTSEHSEKGVHWKEGEDKYLKRRSSTPTCQT